MEPKRTVFSDFDLDDPFKVDGEDMIDRASRWNVQGANPVLLDTDGWPFARGGVQLRFVRKGFLPEMDLVVKETMMVLQGIASSTFMLMFSSRISSASSTLKSRQ